MQQPEPDELVAKEIGEAMSSDSSLFTWGALTGALVFSYQTLMGMMDARDAREASGWLKTLDELDLTRAPRTLEAEARRFWKFADSNDLMHSYHRGFPHRILTALRAELQRGATDDGDVARWMLELIEEAEAASSLVSEEPSDKNFDVDRRHRLVAFPLVMSIQCIALASDQVQQELSQRVAAVLESCLELRGHSLSTADQLLQIIPQVFTDQLLAGQLAWDNLLISRPVLEHLIGLGGSTQSREYRTGHALSLQFLIYYRKSLDSPVKRARFDKEGDVDAQAKRIDLYLGSIDSGEKLRSVQRWVTQLKRHVDDARAPYHVSLVRQSSAAIMGAYHGMQLMPRELWYLSIVNSLEAATRSLGLPDEEDRLARGHEFLVKNGVARVDLEVLKRDYLPAGTPVFDFARDLTSRMPKFAVQPTAGPELVSAASGFTLCDIWGRMFSTGTIAEGIKTCQRRATQLSVVRGMFGPFLHRFMTSLGKQPEKRRAVQQMADLRLKRLLRDS